FEPYTTDTIAKTLLLYQKDSNSNYWDFHGLDSLSTEAELFLAEDENTTYIIETHKRINIKNDQKYRFNLKEE
ncbi:MAG: hypothetical protein K2K01_02205, partial [Eubacterium sp.]|nr:hypothetical protein [Eubacterium sp.]